MLVQFVKTGVVAIHHIVLERIGTRAPAQAIPVAYQAR